MAVMRVIALFLLGFAAPAQAFDDAVIFSETFDVAGSVAAYQRIGDVEIVDVGDRSALKIHRDGGNGSSVLQIPIAAEQLHGLVHIVADVKAENVGERPNSWNGIKVMLRLEMEDGSLDYPQLPLPVGSFDWTTVRRGLRLPPDVRKATLVLGLEQVSGTVWIDSVEIRKGRILEGDVADYQRTPFRGHDLERLRGVMHGPTFNQQDIDDLASWGANQVRWQLNWVPMKQAEEWARDLDAYDRWLDGALEDADKAIDACEKHNIRVLLDLHCAPGGRAEGGVNRMFTDKRYQQKFLDVWRMLAERYKGRDIIYAYELINEPVTPGVVPEGLMTWRELADETVRIIREIDPDKPIVVEPGTYGTCDGFDWFAPLEADRIIYSFHQYKPHEFTHQFKMTDRFPDGLVYPGEVNGRMWDKETLRESMLPAIDFQRDFNVSMYCGEFSAIRWAPDGSAYRYIRDVIDLCEEYGWDWSYHAYREWPGWSVEHTTDPNDWEKSETPTKRELLLKSWFEKNEK